MAPSQDSPIPDSPSPRRILVVCTANQCRSPMAEGLIRAAAAARGLGDRVVVTSSGTWAEDGHPATRHAVVTLAERGIDIRGHVSRSLDPLRVATADLILVMTDNHRQALLAEFPAARGKVMRMSELAGGAWDVADPIGGPIEDYRATADELARLIERGWDAIAGGAR